MKNLFAIMLIIFSFEIKATEIVSKKNKIERVIDISGIRIQTLNSENIIKSQEIPLDPNLPQEVRDGLRDILRGHYSAHVILERLEKTLDLKFSEKEIDELLFFYHSPEIMKISAIEMKESTVEAEREKLDYAKELMGNPPKKERIAIFEDYDKKFKYTEFHVELVVSFLDAISSANGQPWDFKQREDTRKMLAPQYAQFVLHNMLFTYRSLSNEEIKKYFMANYNNKYVVRLSSLYLEEARKYNNEWGRETGVRLKKFGEEIKAKYHKK